MNQCSVRQLPASQKSLRTLLGLIRSPGDIHVLEYDWENSVGHWIVNTSHALRKHIGARFLREGITFRQWEVLAWLSSSGRCGSQSELAEALGIEPHTMAGVINRMQRDGLLDRRSCDQDRRKNQIRPTEKAEELWRRVSSVSQEFRRQAVQGFSPEELAQLRDFCQRIRDNLEYIEPIQPVSAQGEELPRTYYAEMAEVDSAR